MIMTEFLELRKSVNGNSIITHKNDYTENLDQLINLDPTSDYYRSMFLYPVDIVEHHKKNKGVGKFSGKVEAPYLLFDIDSKQDLNLAKSDTSKLMNSLFTLTGLPPADFLKCVELYFSGNKGFHVVMNTQQSFTPKEMKSICKKIAKDAGITETLDSAIYNTTRIIRIEGTVNTKSGLYKIQLDPKSFKNLSCDDIKKMAKSKGEYYEKHDFKFDFSNYKDLLKEETKKSAVVVDTEETVEGVRGLDTINFKKCPNYMPRCMYALSKGVMVPGRGERHTIYLGLARFWKNQGYTDKETYRLLKATAEANVALYPEFNVYEKDRIWSEIIVSVYDDKEDTFFNKGGWGVNPKNDTVFKKYCNLLDSYTSSNCIMHSTGEKDTYTVDELLKDYAEFSKTYEESIIKTGISFIDEEMEIMRGTVSLIVGAAGCHRKGEKVRMFDGSTKNVEDVELFEKLMGPDNKPRVVLDLKRGKEPIYKVAFNRGKVDKNKPKFYNESHILHFLDGNKKDKIIKQTTIKEYIELPEWCKEKHYILRQNIDYPEQKLETDPYLLGLWLGDGDSSGLTFTTKDQEIVNYLSKIAKENNLVFYNKEKRENFCERYTLTKRQQGGLTVNQVWEGFTNENLKNNKHIPEKYIINSYNNRLKLLAGVVDSDGHLSDNIIEIVQKNKTLAKQIQSLCFSLGYQATLTEKVVDEKTYYRLHISGDIHEIPVLLERKKPRVRKQAKNVNRLSFTVEKVSDEENYYGFTVSDDNLYVDDDYLVTRNSGKTTFALKLLENASKAGIPTVMFSMDMNKRPLFEKLFLKHTSYNKLEVREKLKNNDKNLMLELEQILETHYKHVVFVTKGTMTSEEMKNRVLEIGAERGKIGLVLVDYAGRISSGKSDSYANDKHNALRAPEIASDTDAAWVYLAQVGRNHGDSHTPLRTKRAAKGAGDWEEAAQNVLTIWRPFADLHDVVYEEDDLEEPLIFKDGFMRCYTAKNRMGKSREVILLFNGKNVEEMSERQTDEYLEDFVWKEKYAWKYKAGSKAFQ